MGERHTVRWARAPETLWRQGPFGVVLLPPGSTQPRTLTGTGPALWAALSRPMTRRQLGRHLAHEFAAEPHRVETDVTPLLDELEELGALRVLRVLR